MRRGKQPVIGIVPSFDHGVRIPAGGGNVKRIYLRYEYTALIASVGAVPVILNQYMSLDTIMELCDGIVISGGEDIDPSLYGVEPAYEVLPYIEPTDRFEWETDLIKACDQSDIPILGICYGMQRLNIHYGGTLMQDIDTYLPDNIGHFKVMHDISFDKEFLGMKSRSRHTINSRHHQAIERLAEGFAISAVADDGIIEAIEGKGHFGMQWHPESDETGAHVYRSFVEYVQSV